jgi:dienelactone hydrolase
VEIKESPLRKTSITMVIGVVEWLNKQGINKKDIILYGESLGTGVATELASNNKFAGVILESPFTSIADAAKIYYPVFTD